MQRFSREDHVATRRSHSRKPRSPAAAPIARARSATSTTSATACSSSRPIASRRSTTCSARASRTRARSSRRSRRSGSSGPAAIVAEPRRVDRPGRLSRPRPAPTRPCCAAARCSCTRTEPLPIECVARGYLSGSGWKDYVGDRRGLRHRAARRAARIRPPARSRSSRRPPRPQSGHDINISEAEAAALVGADVVLARVRDLTLAPLRRGRRARRVARHHRRRHEVRVRPDRRERPGRGSRDPDRRGADARLVAVLAAGRLPARAARSRASTSSSCATTSSASAGTSSRPCPSLPDDVVARTREKYVEAFRRLTGRELRVSQPMISDRLEQLVEEMVDKGVQFEDAVREFEKRFIARVLGRCDGSLDRRPPTRSASTATRSAARWPSTGSNAGPDRPPSA